jgi:O-antigen biosynthesis protein WbqP
MKRLFDIVLSILLIPVSLPITVIMVMLVRFESEGPAIFIQERLGKHQKRFRCYKIRTMKVGTVNAASHLIGDSQITRVGRFLRSTKLDELPQLWNVIRGDMSFVGPRPGLPNQIELTKVRQALGIFEVTPGITGLAQIYNIDMSDPERLAHIDRDYIDNQSILLDLKIIFKTLTGSGRGDAAK